MSLCIVEFENGATALIENSWARRGGMDDKIEVFGEAGCSYANLHMGNAMPTYSENGYGYAVEKAPTTKGWTYPVFEELWNYGTPQELTHFARCVRGKEKLQSTGEDGLVVHESYAMPATPPPAKAAKSRSHTRRPPAPSAPSTSGSTAPPTANPQNPDRTSRRAPVSIASQRKVTVGARHAVPVLPSTPKNAQCLHPSFKRMS